MTSTIDIAIITGLSTCCIFLVSKQKLFGSNDDSLAAEKIPLFEDRESKLTENTRLLREEQSTFQKLQDEFKEKNKEFEAQKVELVERESSVREAEIEQKTVGKDLMIRAKEVGKHEAKLKEDLQLFETEKLVQANRIAENLESQKKEVEMRVENLQEEARILQEERDRLKKSDESLASRIEETNKQEAKLQEEARILQEGRDGLKKSEVSLAGRIEESNKQEAKLQKEARILQEKRDGLKKSEESLAGRIEETKKQEANLQKERDGHKQLMESLVGRIEETNKQEAKIQEEARILQGERDGYAKSEERLASRIKEVEEREAKLEKDTQFLEQLRIEQQAIIGKDLEEVTTLGEDEMMTLDEEESVSTSAVEDDEDKPSNEEQEPVQSEAEKRKTMIEEEVKSIVKEADEKELRADKPFDDDSIEALMKGAMEVCYRKKYYDVMNDNLIFFPSVMRAALDYRLMEEAEKFYFSEDDEYPSDLCRALRNVAFEIITENGDDDDYDEKYMTPLSMDFGI
uniref:Uncharacterized protein n=1 Tax=Pseudo-nitzschia australis TaxID=44445 RepID=A0A7S4ARQ4_9STRA|eukprot:CAMPEP_0168224522 /NCGR_PEP_ID=MMETSP0140_2-20121125/12112_1 /TAXON_ID=44445 /ORGANISM="Pseudo-nitzschia australis, Strain 10249 10 AB" /LENGTH=516 /DNA_ID=CAMNT_0008154923 /DNA_START=9 /DNA_END=1559 /DNA_ORIENTATION=+